MYVYVMFYFDSRPINKLLTTTTVFIVYARLACHFDLSVIAFIGVRLLRKHVLTVEVRASSCLTWNAELCDCHAKIVQ